MTSSRRIHCSGLAVSGLPMPACPDRSAANWPSQRPGRNRRPPTEGHARRPQALLTTQHEVSQTVRGKLEVRSARNSGRRPAPGPPPRSSARYCRCSSNFSGTRPMPTQTWARTQQILSTISRLAPTGEATTGRPMAMYKMSLKPDFPRPLALSSSGVGPSTSACRSAVSLPADQARISICGASSSSWRRPLEMIREDSPGVTRQDGADLRQYRAKRL